MNRQARMKATSMLRAFAQAQKQVQLVGDLDAGAIIALDMEGRLFAVLDGQVLNRVNPDAIAGESTQKLYLNPGGDGLWPAPEGTSLGYQYATGAWRVTPGLRAARYRVARAAKHEAEVIAEVDLINAQDRGIPTLFKREIVVTPGRRSLTVRTVESITYIGRTPLRRTNCLLAPWTLCQFDSGPGCEVVFPCTRKADVWDLYDDPSDAQRQWGARMCRTATNGAQRYQIAISAAVPWIEYRDPQRGLRVRRQAGSLPKGQAYIDIRDAAPEVPPTRQGVRYSVYSDVSGFMEIEAVGGCPAVIRPDTQMSIAVTTQFART
jgi:hypothetical protein